MPDLGSLPKSEALSEADPASLNELLATLPEDETWASRSTRIIAACRAQRERWARAETLKREAPRAKRGPGASVSKLLESRPAEVSSDDLGL